jgi:hypothetical protein
MARFDGKKLSKHQSDSDGIKKPEELINRIISGDAPKYTTAPARSTPNPLLPATRASDASCINTS